MSEEDILRSNEDSALDNNQIISSVAGKSGKKSKSKVKKGFSAAIFITLMIVLFLAFFSSGNLIPAAISERLIEVTDVQYADAVKTKSLVFQNALSNGEVPSNTVARLKNDGVLVGNTVNGEFVESESGTSLQYNGKVISAGQFSEEVSRDAGLYNAFNNATYSRAAYYYDDSAQDAFKRMGISRNNFSGDESFEEVMTEVMGEGNNITVNNGEESSRTINVGEGEDADVEVPAGCTASEPSEDNVVEVTCRDITSISAKTAAGFVNDVGNQNKAHSANQATLNAADTLAVADSISQEQRSSKFYVAVMENISKMKAGYGNDSRINETMNYLYSEEETQVVDVATGAVTTVKGSMLESPSLYSVLSGEKMNVSDAANYSSERILKTVENQGLGTAGNSTVSTTLAASNSNKGTIGRLVNGSSSANNGTLSTVTPTVSSSLVDNSFNSIKGINGGELLVQGAVNVGAALALESGATVGDAQAVKSYARVTEAVLALDAEVDRMNRSPFDITSKNTFLGSIMYKFAVSTMKSGTLLNKVASFSRVTANSIMSFLPMVSADDEDVSYMTATGNCEHMKSIGAAGTASCARNETFDTSTYRWIFDDPDAQSVLEDNLERIDENTWRIKDGSDFEKFEKYNMMRETPVGVMDGSIVEELNGTGSSGSGTFSLRSIWQTVIGFFSGETSKNKKIASGELYVNSSENSNNWKVYKYAQRYVSIARARDALRQYDGDQTAYSNIPYLGVDNPVTVCREKIYAEILAANN